MSVVKYILMVALVQWTSTVELFWEKSGKTLVCRYENFIFNYYGSEIMLNLENKMHLC